ncbi:MAG TPA: O-antigen ligase family protein [Thermoleophilaceae bacterium]|jgi:O-antigen ligase
MAARLNTGSHLAYQALLGTIAVGLGLLAGLDPRLAVAAAIGLAFVVLVLGDLTFGLCLFAIVSFLDLLPTLGGSLLSFSKIVGLLIAVSWLAKVSTSNDARNDFLAAHPVFSYVLGLFLGWTALSLTWAEDAAAGRTSVMRFALNLILFLIVYTAVRTPKQFVLTVGAYVTGAAVAAAYGLLFPPQDTAYYDVSRVGGTLGDPNELAAVLVPGMILGAALAFSLKRFPMVRIAAVVASILCAAGVFLTLSRGGLIAAVVALSASAFVAGRWRIQAITLAVVAVFGGLFYFGFVASQDAVNRVTEVEGGSGRTDLWKVGLRMVQAKPVSGVGVGNFQTASIHYLLQPGALKRDEFIVDNPKSAHNTYLHVLAELGFVGFALFAAIILFALLCILRAARIFDRIGRRDLELLARALLVAITGVLAADFFISEMFGKQLWLLLGLGPALLGVARTVQAERLSARSA